MGRTNADPTNRSEAAIRECAITRRGVIGGGLVAAAALFAACTGSDATESAGSSTEPTTDLAPGAGDGRRVIVIGAGAAGMTAAYLLRQRGVIAEVIEAGPTHGGRIKHDLEFADFPIPLGAEWIHVDPAVLDEIVDDSSVSVDIDTVEYADGDELAYYDGDGTDVGPLEGWESDRKIIGSSWLDFFERYIVPSIAEQFAYETPIVTIDHTGDTVRLTSAVGDVFEADQVIVTVPLEILQRGDIDFVPPFEGARAEAVTDAVVWSGLKAFIEFDTAFYPAVTEAADSYTADGQRIYYDAAYGQDSDFNILGLFSVGAQAERYQQALADGELLDVMLAELDEVFDGAASPAYVRHIVQNWNDEPFARAAYLEDDAPSSVSRRLAEPIDGRVFFAGDAYTSFDDWGSVHTATRSAAEAVDGLLA